MENILPDAGKLLEISLQYEERAIGDSPLLHSFSICSSRTMGLGSICGGRERSPLEDPVKNGACLRNVGPRRGP